MVKRRVPLRLWVAVVFGHVLTTFGWLWVAAALGVTLDRTDVAWHHDMRTRSTAIVDRVVIQTAAGKTKAPYAEIYYHFADELGRTYHGMSEDWANRPPDVGGEVAVEYEARDPSFSKLVRDPSSTHVAYASPDVYTPGYMLIVFVCALPGLALVVGMGLRARRMLRALRRGELVKADVIERVTEGAGKDAMTFVTYEYTVGDDRHRRTIQVENPERFASGATEPVLVDPACPRTAMLLDDLPARAELRDGELLAAMPPAPALAALACAAFVAYKLSAFFAIMAG